MTDENTLTTQPDFLRQLESMVSENETIKTLSKRLMSTPHYAKMREEGIFAVLIAAKTYNVNPFTALNGGFHFIQGRVSMSAELMSKIIREKGHSIKKDPQSNSQKCKLIGKRADNGDEIEVSYTIVEAEKAGYLKKDNWNNHPQAMLYAYCLRMLARQLFSDVIFNVLVEGEDPSIEEGALVYTDAAVETPPPALSDEQVVELDRLSAQVTEIAEKIKIRAGILNWASLDPAKYEATKNFLSQAVTAKLSAAAEGN